MKRCKKCGLEKREELFGKDISRKDGLGDRCRTCSNKDSRDYYDRNQEKILEQLKQRQPSTRNAKTGSRGAKHNRLLYAKKMTVVRSYKQERGCERCGENHPAVLDLHHRDPDTKNPRLSYRNGKRVVGSRWRYLSFSDLAAELEKCDVLCANCHRKVEWEVRQQSEVMHLETG